MGSFALRGNNFIQLEQKPQFLVPIINLIGEIPTNWVTQTLAVLRYHFYALRRGWSTFRSAASSASLRSVSCAAGLAAHRMVEAPRAKSVTWIARAATGKSGGMSPALIPSRKRLSRSAAPPRDRALEEVPERQLSFTSGATHIRRQPRADPFSVACTFDCVPEKAPRSRSRKGSVAQRSARFRGVAAPFRSAYAFKRAQEYRPLVAKNGVQARAPHTHPFDEIVNRHAVVAFRPL